MLRIHFTCEDLARVTIAPAPDPLWETVLSLRVLDRQPVPARVEGWRLDALGRLSPPARWLVEVVRSCPQWPDFLTPTRGGQSLEQSMAALARTSPRQVRADLARLEANGGAGAWPRALAGVTSSVLASLGRTVVAYFEAVLAPYWLRIQSSVEGERARLTRVLADSGMERMLAGLWPGVIWEPPVLLVPCAFDGDLYLRGRELVLLPSLFCTQAPLTRLNPELAPVLVFSVQTGSEAGLRPDQRRDREVAARRLTPLIGRTRTAVLQALSTACTTSELARRVGTSLASASQHATVLRGAGLVTSTRHRNAVVHTATALGSALLERART